MRYWRTGLCIVSLPILVVAALFAFEQLAFARGTAEHAAVPMTDGTKLATDIHLPSEGEGPWPVILIRSTYGRAHNRGDFQKQGYVGVVQDVRGMGTSEGEKHVFFTDGWRKGLTDGADTVAWVKAQPWCNGKVATLGGSALAITQMLLAPVAQGLDAQYVAAVPSDLYRDTSYHGGVFRKSLVETWLYGIGQPHVIPIYKSHPYRDEFWSYYNVAARAKDITAPGLFVNGWYDIFQQGTIDGFVTRQEQGGEGARGQNYLVMKWSSHRPDDDRDYKFNPNRHEFPVSKLRNAFFDRHLKGIENALEGFANVNYYVMGADTPGAPGNEWRTADAWPPFPTASMHYYLHADGTLQTTPQEETEASQGFTFDPKNPYPTHGGSNLALMAGPFDQRKHSKERTDYLAFATAPLEAPIEVTGRLTVKLFVSTDAPDTDFVAKLIDIYPAGDEREILILDNAQRLKMRDGFERPAPLLTGPDQIVEVEIDLWSISWIFDAGHRIGLHVSSSNYPRFEVNPNTGADHPTEKGEMRIAHNVVHFDHTRPSALILPIPKQ